MSPRRRRRLLLALLSALIGVMASGYGVSWTSDDAGTPAAEDTSAVAWGRDLEADQQAQRDQRPEPAAEETTPVEELVPEEPAEESAGESSTGLPEESTSTAPSPSEAAPVPDEPAATSSPAPAPVAKGEGSALSVPAGTWLSGGAGDGVASGEMGAWRGRSMEIAGTWSDNNEAMVELWQLRPGGEFGDWDRPLEIAIGGIEGGETWEQAAQGAYDARWRQSLTNLRDIWGSRPGTVFIRLAHEMNGDWFPWAVNSGNYESFIEAWKRFRGMQQEIFPASQLVFSVNRESLHNGMDWRDTFPGAEHVDVMSVDYYNQWPYVDSAAAWEESLHETDSYGAPKGLQQHLDFARSVGLPLGISEWSGNADNGDAPAYIEGMYRFFSENAGSGAGQVLYDVHFNVDRDGNRWCLFGSTRMPASAEAYRNLW